MVNKPPTILIVEDESALNQAYQIILRKAGYTVVSAYDGEDALTKAKHYTPDLILLDLRMPHMDGLNFLRHYKLRELHPHVKVIVFSNYDIQQDIDEAYQQGADRYILKAWASPNELLKVVRDTLVAPKVS